MTDLAPLIAARDALNNIIEAVVFDPSNDWQTAPLDGRGIWRPAFLGSINARVLKMHPDFWINGPSLDAQGKPITRSPYRLIDGFVFQRITSRDDLTQKQRDFYQSEHNRTFLAATTGDFGNVLAYLPLDVDDMNDGGRGYFTASLHSGMNDASKLPALVEKLYRTHGLLPAEG